MNISEIRQYTWNFFRNKGLTEESTSALMGNIQMESGFDPNIVEGGSGVGFGLCQWSYSRRIQLQKYGTSLSHQLYFLWSELTGEDTDITGADFQWINPPASSVTGGEDFDCSIDEFLNGDGDIDFLTTAFCYCWERPAPETNHLDERIDWAYEFYDTYATGEEPTEPIEPPAPEPTAGEVYTDIENSAYNTNKLSEEQKEVLQSLSYKDRVKLKYSFQKNKNIVGHSPTNKRLTLDDKEYIIYSVRNDGLIDVGLDENVSTHKYIDARYIILID